MTIDIKDINGNIRLSIPINRGAKGRCSLGGDDYVTLPLVTDAPVAFAVGDYIDLREAFGTEMGGRLAKIYKLLSVPKPTASAGRYEYELRFDAYYMEWNNKVFRFDPEHSGQEASWSMTAPLDEHLGVFLRNLEAHGFKYAGTTDYSFDIDGTVEKKAVTVTYDNIRLLDALYSLCAEDKFDCDCWITESVIHFGRCEHGTAVKMELGAEAASMSRSESSGTYATRIYAFGSDRNIPADYRPATEQAVVNGVVQKRLMLPQGTPYVDARPNLTEAEAVEQIVVFDDIYPHRIGTMSNVHARTATVQNEDGTEETVNFYRYRDTGLAFDSKYILKGKELQIIFQSGLLNGMTFVVIFNPDDAVPEDQLWEIVRNEDSGRPLPDSTLYPREGDQYILSGFDIQLVSDQYIPEAEQELLEAAKEYVKKCSVDDGSYSVTLFPDWVHADLVARTFDIGQKVLLKNPAYFGPEGRESRVTGWEFNLDIPYDSPVYEIGESAGYSRLGRIESQLEELTFKGQTYAGNGGGVYVIRVNDVTPPSDSNVYSALRTLRQFVRKDVDDAVAGLLSMDKGLQSSGFLQDVFAGAGFGIFKDKDGRSYMEIDELAVLMKAVFAQLEIMHVSHVGGEFVLSPAGMTISKVEEVPATAELYDGEGNTLSDFDDKRLAAQSSSERVYRCYFRDNDGDDAVVNMFKEGDLARCQTFNLAATSEYKNLLTDGMLNIEGATRYLITEVRSASELVPKSRYTVVFKAALRNAAIGIWDNAGSWSQKMFYPDDFDENGVAFASFTYNPNLERPNIDKHVLRFYNYPSATSAEKPADLEWVCLYEGNIAEPPTEYVPYSGDGISVTRQYWRRVVGIGSDYVDLSVSDCLAGSDIPRAGDTIAALGSKTDASRQNAIVISSYGAGSPSIKLYMGIDDYELSDTKCPIVISPNGNKFTGTFVSTAGQNIVDMISGKSDNKIYTQKPSGLPYKKGDLWVNATDDRLKPEFSNEIMTCVSSARSMTTTEGTTYIFSYSDWKPAGGYSTEIKQTENSIKMSVYALGQSPRNYAVIEKTAKLEYDSAAYPQQTIFPIGTMVTDGLSVGDTLYLSLKWTAADTGSSSPSVSIALMSDTTTAEEFEFDGVAAEQTATGEISDEQMTVTTDYPVDGTMTIALVVTGANLIDITVEELQISRLPSQPYSEAKELPLVRTGIDIFNRKIVLQADTTVFRSNGGKETVKIFTDSGKIRAELVDADAIVAKRVEAVSDIGKVAIEDGAMTMSDAEGNMKLKIHGGTLSQGNGQETTVPLEAAYNYSFDTSQSPQSIYKTETLLTVSVDDGAYIRMPAFELFASMFCNAEMPSDMPMTLRMEMYFGGKLIATFEASADVLTQTLAKLATTEVVEMSLEAGQYPLQIVAYYSSPVVIDSASCSAVPIADARAGTAIAVSYPTDYVEIASDGFRAASAGQKYIMQTADKCEMRFKENAIRITANGIEKTMDGGLSWQPL